MDLCSSNPIAPGLAVLVKVLPLLLPTKYLHVAFGKVLVDIVSERPL